MAAKCPKCQTENSDSAFFCSGCGIKLESAKEFSLLQTKTMRSAAQELRTGSTFAGRYEIIEELGRGGMGTVYKVFDTKVNEKIALKLIRPDIAADRETIERFSSEIRLSRQISHRNVCRMYDLGEADGARYITMEFVPGEDLKSMIRMSRTMSMGAILGIGKQVCEGLSEAHGQGIIHRDLKPQNIMIDKGGNAKIMDFGIARSVREEGHTGPGVVIGTPHYMSPEQADGKEVDQRSDIYSLGIILYEMAAGRVPFEGDTALSIALKQRGESPRNPKESNPGLSDDLCGVILKCLEKGRERRYQNAAELRANLEKIEKGIPTAERLVPRKKPLTSQEITVKFSLKKLIWPGLSVVALAIIAVILWRVSPARKGTAEPQKPPQEIAALPESGNSIAVLPFKNISQESGQDYFCDGMTDELIAKLSKIRTLRVISRNSAFTFKNTLQSTRDIARQLQVRSILDGSVRKAGDRLRISVQLIDAVTDAPIWSETYDKNLDDIFEVQETVAQAIVDALRIKITPEEKQRITERPIDNIHAYQCYLRARQAVYSYARENLDQAYEEIQEALRTTGDNVLLYSTLGVIHYQYANQAVEREQNLRKAQETVARIFLLEPDSPSGHRLLGLIQLREGKAREAVGHLKKALASDPSDFDTLYWLTYIYSQAGKIPAARETCLKLTLIDPVFASPDQKFYIEIMDGQFDRALEIFRSSGGSSNAHLRFWEIWILAFTGRLEETFNLIERFHSDYAQAGDYDSMLQFLKHSLQGQKSKALASITSGLIDYCQNDEQWSWMLAGNYALIGEKETALRWLETAVNRGFVNYPFISKHDPFLRNVRGESRYRELLSRVKHEWEHFEEP